MPKLAVVISLYFRFLFVLCSLLRCKLPQPLCSDILGVCSTQNLSSRSALPHAEAHISAQPPEAE